MRSRLNLALVVIAGAFALVLTVIRQSPDGGLGIQTKNASADSKNQQAAQPRHDLSALSIFNKTLLRIKERYVDPSRIDPKKMLYAALDSVQYNIPEVLVEADAARNKVTVAVNDKREVFETDDVDSPWRLAAKLKRIFRFIEANMNAGADLAKVEYAAVNGMLSTLDPHSILMDPEQARDMDVSTSGKFGGLGIVIRMIERKLTVIKPMKDTPAWRAGIKAGDIIVKINNEVTENLTSGEAVDRMRGDPRTSVTLWVQRKGADPNAPLLRFDLTRDVIRVSQVDHKLLDKGVGYIKVKQFSKGIASDVAEAMKEMSSKGATSWILDLRGNPGGLLEEAVQLGDLFVDSGTLVTTVSGRDREARRAERGGEAGASLVVLVSPGSASASEIVAGALKNLDRAAIIGQRSFGKGSVQELYDNDDHSKLKLTIAQYLTPGDRSIQNLGIVPDISLQRMYIPDKNDAPGDYIRMLAPTKSYGEKDLDAHLTSTYAKDTDKPAYELSYMVERKKPTAGQQPVAKPDDEDDTPDDDEIVEDFEIRFAKDVVSSVVTPNRQRLVAAAQRIVGHVRSDEEKKLASSLNTLGVDWSGPTSQAEIANLDATMTTALVCRPVAGAPDGTCANVPNASATSFRAGDIISVTASVKNTGTGAAYRVLPRLHADDNTFEDTELPVGKIGPGETKTFTTKIKIPEDAYDRIDHVNMELREAKNAVAHVTPAEVRIEAAPRPVFAYAYQLVDDSNGDGLVQRGEKYRLQVSVKNTGAGPTQEATVLLRNLSGDGVTLGKSRFEIKDAIAPGQVRELEFPLATDATLKGDEVVVELMAYDAKLDVTSSEKIHFKVAGAVPGTSRTGEVTARTQTPIRSGAADDTGVIGTAVRGASYQVIGSYGAYTKVRLSPTHIGFIPTAALGAGGAGSGSYSMTWNSTPPNIALKPAGGLETHAETYKLGGTITDEQHVEDVYVYVSNQGSHIESRKVFYRSNRGGKDGKALDFSADVPLWPGSNMVVVVARASSEVRSVKTMFVYRDPPRTAQATPPNSP